MSNEKKEIVSRDVLAIFLILLVTILSCYPLFKNIHNINSNQDWLQMASYYRFSRQSILEDQQFPLRTPYFGGGYPLLANPQDGSLNPFFIPVLIFGEVIGIKINVFLAHIIAALGMYYLTRYVFGFTHLGALFSVFVFCLGGRVHRLLIRGQDYIPGFFAFFTPLCLAFFIKAQEKRKYLLFSIFILTVVATQAGLHFVSILLFIFLFSLLKAFKYKERKFIFDTSYLKNFFIIILFVFLLGAVKIFPMLELLIKNPRYAECYYSFGSALLPKLYKAFLIHKFDFPFASEHWHYFYLGYLPIIFSMLAFVIYWKKMKKYLILLIVFMLLAFGAHTRLDLFKLLWQLPLFHSIDTPTRYFSHLAVFIIAIVSGQFFSITDKIKTRFMTSFFILMLSLAAIDLFFTNTTYEESFPLSMPKYEHIKQTAPFHVKNLGPEDEASAMVSDSVFVTRSRESIRPTQYELMLQNIGKINWYGNIHLTECATPRYYIDWNEIDSLEPQNYTWHLNPDYKGEIYFLNNPRNKAEFKRFTANKIVAQVRVLNPDTLIINQNYDKYWKSDFGVPENYKGLLAINLNKKGEYSVNFVYIPISFYLGLGVSLATLILIIYLFKVRIPV